MKPSVAILVASIVLAASVVSQARLVGNEETKNMALNDEFQRQLKSVDAQNIQFKMYWTNGTVWQGSKKPKAWCGQCKTDCSKGDVVIITTCDSTVPTQRWNFKSGRIIPTQNTGVCIDYSHVKSNIHLFLKTCKSSRDGQQLWSGFDASNKFQLHPQSNSAMCMTDQHEPRIGEYLEIVTCKVAATNTPGVNDDTSHWSAGCWDGHYSSNHWNGDKVNGCG